MQMSYLAFLAIMAFKVHNGFILRNSIYLPPLEKLDFLDWIKGCAQCSMRSMQCALYAVCIQCSVHSVQRALNAACAQFGKLLIFPGWKL
jgi:hypothetical protein